jgi:Glycosyl transferase family 2
VERVEMHETLTWEPMREVSSPIKLELIVPVVNRENDIRSMLTRAADCLLNVTVRAGIAVVDGGSSDRTLEAVDEVAATSLLLIRTVGCSRPGWAAAVLRGVATSRARWVALADPDAFDAETAVTLRHAVRLLAAGVHIVCSGPQGRRSTVLDASVAELIVGEQMPDGPEFVPELLDTARHAGLRMAAHGRVARAVRHDSETTTVLERVS